MDESKNTTDQGFTLIEILMFIVIMGIAGVSVLVSMNTILKGTVISKQQMIAAQTATRCMEWYLKQRYTQGFNTATLNVGTNVPGFCTPPTGYNLDVSVENMSMPNGDGSFDDNYKVINVNVTGLGEASLKMSLANY